MQCMVQVWRKIGPSFLLAFSLLPATTWGQLELTVSCVNSQVACGDPVPLILTLRNVGPDTVDKSLYFPAGLRLLCGQADDRDVTALAWFPEGCNRGVRRIRVPSGQQQDVVVVLVAQFGERSTCEAVFQKPGIRAIRAAVIFTDRSTAESKDAARLEVRQVGEGGASPGERLAKCLESLGTQDKSILLLDLTFPSGEGSAERIGSESSPAVVECLAKEASNQDILGYVASHVLRKYYWARLCAECAKLRLLGPEVKELDRYKKMVSVSDVYGKEVIPCFARERAYMRGHTHELCKEDEKAKAVYRSLLEGGGLDYAAVGARAGLHYLGDSAWKKK